MRYQDYDVSLQAVSSGFDGQTCWVHPRAGAIPPQDGKPAIGVLTLQKLILSGSDLFLGLNGMRSDDGGRTWTDPAPLAHFGRRRVDAETEMTVCDFTPGWHERSGRILGLGHTVYYRGARIPPIRPRETPWAVYDSDTDTWSEWSVVAMPNEAKFYNSGSGCAQWAEAPNGDVLVPIYFKAEGAARYRSAVMRCSFDGERMEYLTHGSELGIETGRGLYEPSVISFRGKYYLTMRNDFGGYVTSGVGGVDYDPVRSWCFDDGRNVGSYNTQQHWVKCGDKALFLVYTRRGEDNGHVFRHRAPLFIAQVDVDRLCLIRETERILVPERGARLGNFGVTHVSEREAWVTVAEWMQPVGCEQYGSDNTVFLARIMWKKR